MVRQLLSVDISTMPELARLADEVSRTRTPRVLRRGSEDVALLVPAARRHAHARAVLVDTSALPPVPQRTVDELAGFAGSLAQPLSWQDMRAIVDDERVEAYRAKHP